ncbi:putative transcriptional regulator [Zymomonas mobilis]|uniref:helix-turn-helix domain-containing protein n=1 Tax=Zymomonas mobilis TaxID=542 RepID=UPI00026D81F5|nr:helix-turn-helix domain-containing protein [Zymomonas mobilis]AFN57578.1 helix-turn-helix domain protein [Zymomonas mobilis subsp. mobilis ATCC 29191]TQK74405.1 putative transcriptional regulator [Zymomonas mobilis]TQL14659.1 putative transcriptional regulator [Zymomonas mobilis]GEB88293.1 transcriptional regulator [Zymomonas mobilis subsp. mobilis]
MKKEHIILPADPNDPEDFAVSREALERGLRGRLIRKARKKLGLSQQEFASRFKISVGTLRDWEQSRSKAPDFAIAYVKVIARAPDMVAETVAA